MIQSLQKGVDALMYLASKRNAGVTEIADAIGVNKSTAYRIMETFLYTNMVDKNSETSKYKLGPAILKLSQQYYNGLSVVTIAKPYMMRLSDMINESVHLCICSNSRAVVVEQIISDGRLIANAHIGAIEPLHCSSVGKCLLAFADSVRFESMLREITFDKFTDYTITDVNTLNIELEKIRKEGFAEDNNELSMDIRCVAAPIFNSRGECNYSIGVSGAGSRMTDDKKKNIAEKLMKIAEAISDELGYIKIK